jgi:hypothetical protein
MICICANNVRHPVVKNITTLHPVTLYLTLFHFTTLLDNFRQTPYSFHFTPFIISFLSLCLKISGLQRKVPTALQVARSGPVCEGMAPIYKCLLWRMCSGLCEHCLDFQIYVSGKFSSRTVCCVAFSGAVLCLWCSD